MPVFQVRQGATGAILWTGSASNETRALDAMANEAGYYDESDLPESIRQGGLIVETLTFGQPRAAAGRSGDRVTGGRPIGQPTAYAGAILSGGRRKAGR